MIRRIGNKAKLASKIISYFPEFNLLIDAFCGSLAIPFSLPKKCRILANDYDKSIINFYYAVQEHKQELVTKIENAILHQQLFEDLKKVDDSDIVNSAFKFLYQSNTGLYGDNSTMKPCVFNWRKIILKTIDETYEKIKDDVSFTCMDYKDFFKLIDTPTVKDRFVPFIYIDSPYYQTNGKYSYTWKLKDVHDLHQLLTNLPIKWAMSEFDNEVILDLYKDYNIYYINNRQNLRNRRTEILVTNYETNHKLF